jgi:hypothetical protein
VLLEAAHEPGRHGDKEAVLELAVLERARVQAQAAVREDGVHLGAYEVLLGQQLAHGQLVLEGAPPLRAALQVHGAQHEHSVLARAHVHAPALGADLAHAAHDHVADLADVARRQRHDADEPVDARHAAGQVARQRATLDEGAVAAQPRGAAAGGRCARGRGGERVARHDDLAAQSRLVLRVVVRARCHVERDEQASCPRGRGRRLRPLSQQVGRPPRVRAPLIGRWELVLSPRGGGKAAILSVGAGLGNEVPHSAGTQG